MSEQPPSRQTRFGAVLAAALRLAVDDRVAPATLALTVRAHVAQIVELGADRDDSDPSDDVRQARA